MELKKIAFIGSLYLASTFTVNAQTNKVKEESVWLQNQLNALVENKKSSGKREFVLNACDCKYSAAAKEDGGFNFTKSYSFNLNEVAGISYAGNEDNTYDLRIKLKKEKNDLDEMLDLSTVNATLYTSDESKVKELVKRFKAVVKECSASK